MKPTFTAWGAALALSVIAPSATAGLLPNPRYNHEGQQLYWVNAMPLLGGIFVGAADGATPARKILNLTGSPDAVAIDPHTDNPAAQKLSVRLLELAEALAGYAEAKVHVISCWEFEYESFLRESAFAHASEAEIQQSLKAEESSHLQALQKLIAEAKLAAHTLHHVRGKPEKTIAGIVEKIGADVVVMGTVARTGVSGFFIGNTAENVLRQMSCSLVALKPENFTSPIKG